MNAATDRVLKAFHELREPEKRELAAEMIRWTTNLEFPSLTDEDLVVTADELFIELDRAEVDF
ncbi:MAG: hypothetical protein OXT74_14905 [Candidatus Poribacteria bacterium]|nr:hypothetical protein [Candidatus Poribacteria bacterium]MDE0505945.1 hypothetical protein [Candidatus Poribacteria bacterium]